MNPIAATPHAQDARVAGYRLERELGRGRQSVVYLARQSGHDRPVALKVLRRPAQRVAGAAQDFQREFAVLRALAHPDVIQVFAAGSAVGQAFLAMEYASHGSMAARRGPAGTHRTLALMGAAARALAWLHGRGWVHRDLKPANLLLRADGGVALGDFGCARPCGHVDDGPADSVIGTPAYAAPEQSRGEAAQPAADVYSLGVCLHEMLTGRLPYPGVTATELLGQHLMAPIPALPREQAAWQPLLEAMLAKEPWQRPADGRAVLLALQNMELS